MPVADDRRLGLRGRWLAIAAATVLLQFSYWPSVAAVAAAVRDGPQAGAPLALGLALVPVVFMVLAFASRSHRGGGPVLQAMGLFLLVGLPLSLAHVGLGLLAGYGAGGIVALAPSDPPAQRWRWAGLGIVTLYTMVLLLFLPQLALLTASIAPFTVLGLVDQAVEGRADAAR